jgi:hypothetical protein
MFGREFSDLAVTSRMPVLKTELLKTGWFNTYTDKDSGGEHFKRGEGIILVVRPRGTNIIEIEGVDLANAKNDFILNWKVTDHKYEPADVAKIINRKFSINEAIEYLNKVI